MGLKLGYICPICNYTAFTSAGPDRGMMRNSETNTYVCLNCKTIQDLRVQMNWLSTGTIYNIREGEECKDCHLAKFVLWDTVNKPCPKCQTKMISDPSSGMLNWD